jgi:hypothetical protein
MVIGCTSADRSDILSCSPTKTMQKNVRSKPVDLNTRMQEGNAVIPKLRLLRRAEGRGVLVIYVSGKARLGGWVSTCAERRGGRTGYLRGRKGAGADWVSTWAERRGGRTGYLHVRKGTGGGLGIYMCGKARGRTNYLRDRKGAVGRTGRPLFVKKPLFWSCFRTEIPLFGQKTLKYR